MQKVVALSSTEAELMSGTECAQDVVQPDYCATGHFRLSVFR
jgi:hypothetical protein